MKRIIPTIARAGRGMDILLNCAGVQRRHPSESFPDDDWDEVSSMSFLWTRLLLLYLSFHVVKMSLSLARVYLLRDGNLMKYLNFVDIVSYVAK